MTAEVQQMAGCVILDERGGLLLLHRRGRFWELPGGKVEPDEPPVQAAGREGLEETGEVVVIERYLGSIAMTFIPEQEDHTTRDVEYHYYLAAMSNNNIPMAAELETHDNVQYISPEKLRILRELGELSLVVERFMDSQFLVRMAS